MATTKSIASQAEDLQVNGMDIEPLL